jgi:TPR repeat protein
VPAQTEKEVDTFYNRYKAYLKKDFKKSMYFWNSLAKAENPDAQFKLGMTYLNGQGV